MANLIFIDDVEQIAWLVRQNVAPHPYKIIAATPALQCLLNQAGREAALPENYYPENEFADLGLSHFVIVEQVCSLIESRLWSEISFLKDRGVHLGRWYFPSMKILFDSVQSQIYELLAILAKENPKEIHYFHSTIKKPSHFGFVRHNKSHWSEILNVVVKNRSLGAILHQLSLNPSTSVSTPLKYRLLKMPLVSWAWTIQKIYGVGGAVLRLLSARHQERPTLLLMSVDYDIRFLINQIVKHRSFNLLFWQPMVSGSARRLFPLSLIPMTLDSCDAEMANFKVLDMSKRVFKGLIQEPEFRDKFMVNGIDFFSVFEPYFNFFFEEVVPDSIQTYLQSAKLLKKGDVAGVVTYGLSDSRDYALFEAARHDGIKTIIYAHGTYAIPLSRTGHYFDYRNCSHFLSWGPGTIKDVQRFSPPHPEVLPVGSTRLESLMHAEQAPANRLIREMGVPNDRPVVLCVFAALFGNFLYLDENLRLSDASVYRHQKTIVDVFRHVQSANIILKLFPNAIFDDPFVTLFQHSPSRHIFINKWTPFVKLLPAADVVVTDYFETPVFEALAQNKRIIVYSKFNSEAEMAPFKNVLFWANNEAEFKEYLSRALDDPTYAPVQKGQEFLKELGYIQGKGESELKAYDAVRSLCAAGSPHKLN